MIFGTFLNQIGILALLAFIGVIGVKTKILGVDAKTVIEKLVFYFTLPLLIITRLSELEISRDFLVNAITVIILTYFVLLIQILYGRMSAKMLQLPARQKSIHAMHTFLGNIVFLGFPLLDALYPGGEAILYGALYQLVMNTVLWTYGISQLVPEKRGKTTFHLNKLLNPNTIALVIGLMMMLLKIRLPYVLQSGLGGLGGTTLYLAMIYIGILLAETKILRSFTKWDVWLLSFNKLLLIPAMLIFLMTILLKYIPFEIDRLALSVVILEASMPCMTILVILAKRYGADDKKAMENFVGSTVLSLVSLPLVLYFMEMMIGK